ncbi:MAG: WG repeat-containing protein [Clostridia bacterium]|nr:WG repeat-containing protein [Clostridia bacterium]
MTLIDEQEIIYEQEKRKKILKTLIRAIIFLILLGIILLVYISTKDLKKLKVLIDGNPQNNIEEGLVLKNEQGNIVKENEQIYISVQKLSTLLNCQYYNSEYKKKGEDKTKCQIRIQNEYTSYISNSNKIYKVIVNKKEESNQSNDKTKNTNNKQEIDLNINESEKEYEYFLLNDNVKYVNDIIYASEDAIETGFNVSISYDSKKNTISIYTLDYLETLAKSKRNDIVSSTEYDYINKRLLKYGMSIVKDSEGNLGVGSYTNEQKLDSYVASCKYSSIKFNESTKTLSVVTSNDNQKCILYLNLDKQEVEKSITSQYDDIKEVDNNFEYFLIEDDEKYGIINKEGKVIIYPLFEEIGIDENAYTDISNKYIINDKYIPVKQNGLWGLYDIEGKKLIDPQYQNIGCPISQSGEGVVFVPNVKENVNGIVFLYNKEDSLYGLYNAETGEKMAISLSEVFKKIEDGNENYYINYVIDKVNSITHTINVRTEM